MRSPDYTHRVITGKQNEIKLNKVWGGWTPSNSMYLVSERKVGAHSGFSYGKSFSLTPTSNSFSKSNGWGYNFYLGGDAYLRAWFEAIYGVKNAEHLWKAQQKCSDLIIVPPHMQDSIDASRKGSLLFFHCSRILLVLYGP